MLTEKDITDALVTWKGAGLTPPRVANLGEFQTMTRSMLSQYGRLDSVFWKKVVGILAHSERWPRFTDIDETIKSLREKAEGEKAVASLPKPASLYRANLAKIKTIVEHIGNGGSFAGLIQEPADDITAYAKKLFPDSNSDFVKRNYCDIAAVKRFDEMCSSGVACGACPLYGHRQFLKINPRGGNTYMCADSDVCSRYSGRMGQS